MSKPTVPTVPTVLVMAKVPAPGRVKTRLCPPLSPERAAWLADAALQDTIATVDRWRRRHPAAHAVLALAGDPAEAVDDGWGRRLARWQQDGWIVRPQHGATFAARLAHAHSEIGDGTVVQIGMDTPQLSVGLLEAAVHGVDRTGCALGPAADGGWWGLALADARHAVALLDVPMSTPRTGPDTVRALRRRGLQVATLPVLTDVDDIGTAWAVAALAPGTRFAAALRESLPAVTA